MSKFIDCLMLGVWIFEFIYGIVAVFTDKMIPPLAFVAATLVCCIYYISEIAKK